MESYLYVVLALALGSYLIFGIIHRLFLSPVARFPGPKLAAVTFWYEFYYDVLLRGKYAWEIERMHQRYGPIVRINPYELHVSDPDFFDQVYVGPTRRTEKWEWSAKMFGTSQAAVGTVHHDLHRMRRSALGQPFSKRAIAGLEPMIRGHVARLMERLEDSRSPVNLVDAFTALTADIISSYAYGSSYEFLDMQDFNSNWHKMNMELSRNSHLMKQFSWVYDIFNYLPRTIQKAISSVHPLTRELFDFRTSILRHIRSSSAKKRSSDETDSEKADTKSQRTILHALMTSNLPEAERSEERLLDECLTIIAAGTVTTAWALSITVFHLLSNPKKLARLREELSTNESPSTWHELERLPYLTACISEGLRLSHGTSHRLARICPDQPLRFREWAIPAGVPVSMTQMMIHQDPSIFPSPEQFLPERWLQESASEREAGKLGDVARMKHFLVPFSRGTRQCVGMHLAYAEFYTTLAALFGTSSIELTLWETDKKDVEVEHDFFNPAPRLDSKGVRVVVDRNGEE